MRKNVVFIVALLSMFACVPSMQLVSLESYSTSKIDKNFEYKDSLVHISYNFYSPNGNMRFRIYNVSNKPIYIDWKNTLYISSAESRKSYWNDESVYVGTFTSIDLQWTSWLNTNSGVSQGVVNKPERITFLPPNTGVEVSKYSVYDSQKITMSNNNLVTNDTINWKKSKKTVKITKSIYDLQSTPFTFRNYISIAKTEDFKEPMYYDFSFFVSQVWNINARQLVGDFLYKTYMDSTAVSSKHHPYKQVNRFFIETK